MRGIQSKVGIKNLKGDVDLADVDDDIIEWWQLGGWYKGKINGSFRKS